MRIHHKEEEYYKLYGAVVQLGERLTGSQEVTGSSPVSSTEVKGSVRLILTS